VQKRAPLWYSDFGVRDVICRSLLAESMASWQDALAPAKRRGKGLTTLAADDTRLGDVDHFLLCALRIHSHAYKNSCFFGTYLPELP
jgi:hypothetical protein